VVISASWPYSGICVYIFCYAHPHIYSFIVGEWRPDCSFGGVRTYVPLAGPSGIIVLTWLTRPLGSRDLWPVYRDGRRDYVFQADSCCGNIRTFVLAGVRRGVHLHFFDVCDTLSVGDDASREIILGILLMRSSVMLLVMMVLCWCTGVSNQCGVCLA